jgi:rhodanese-related sulfurtransferase
MRHLTANWVSAFLQRHPYAKVLEVSAAHEREGGVVQDNHDGLWLMMDMESTPDFLGQARQHLAFDDYVLVICRFGNRSPDAATQLETAGFKHVYNVLGGYEEIRDATRVDTPPGGFPDGKARDDEPS